MDADNILDKIISQCDKELNQMRMEQTLIWELKQEISTKIIKLRKLGCKKIVINGKFVEI